MSFINKIRAFLGRHGRLGYVLAGIFGAVFFGVLQWNAALADPDSFYHIKITQLMMPGGVVRDFPWLVFTPLAEIFTDHHLLYHIFLLPFVAVSPFFGAKAATIVINVIFSVLFYHFLKKINARWAGFFLFLLISAAPFAFRVSLVKAIGFSLIFVLFILICIYSKKYYWLAAVSFLYVWAYGGWPLSIFIAAVYFTASFIAKSVKGGALEWRPLAATVSGSLAGLVLNPYFPRNLKFYWTQIVEIALVNYNGKVGVGSEWYGFGMEEIFLWAASVMLVFFGGLIFFFVAARRGGEIKYEKIRDAFFFFILSGAFFVAMMRARRNGEYFFPFATLGAAVFWRDYYSREIYLRLRGMLIKFLKSETRYYLILSYFSVIFILSAGRGFYEDKAQLSGGFSFDCHKNAAEALRLNTVPRAIVFTSDWDDWPMLFYYNDYNRYLAGLDATFMYKFSPEFYKKWREIARGEYKGDVYAAVKNDFGASAVFIAQNDIGAMDELFKNDGRFAPVYSLNDKVYILR